MKILFTMVAIKVKNDNYLKSAKKLIKEILEKTNHDVLLSTNEVDYFSDINSEKFLIRNNIKKESKFNHGSEFNYNLKHHAFENIDSKYDFLVYLDCDIKLKKWTDFSEQFFTTIMSEYEFGADRMNCKLSTQIEELKQKGNCLFSHKIKNYDILEQYGMSDDIMESLLPSEHFLILRNEPKKVKLFQKKWEELNNYLQDKNCSSCSWGDGFEIGISARFAKFHKTIHLSPNYWNSQLGFEFNGNKF